MIVDITDKLTVRDFGRLMLTLWAYFRRLFVEHCVISCAAESAPGRGEPPVSVRVRRWVGVPSSKIFQKLTTLYLAEPVELIDQFQHTAGS